MRSGWTSGRAVARGDGAALDEGVALDPAKKETQSALLLLLLLLENRGCSAAGKHCFSSQQKNDLGCSAAARESGKFKLRLLQKNQKLATREG